MSGTDEIQDLPAPGQQDDAGTVQAVETPAPAESSPATDVNKPEDSAHSIVRDVVDARKQEPKEASSAKAEEAGTKPGDQPSARDNENYSDVPFHKHPRFQEVLSELKGARQDAERYRNVDSFLTQNGLAADEAADMLLVGAMAKTNPAEAWKMAKPWVEKLLVAAGEFLPDDLRQRVSAGELSEQAAQELSRARAAVQSGQAQRSFEQQRAQTQAAEQHQRSIVDTVQSWEADRKVKDPNFDAKYDLLQSQVALLHTREGLPKTPQGVADQLQRAYEMTNKVFVAPTPAGMIPVAPHARRPAVRPVTGGQVAANAQPKPESTLDIVRAHRAARA